MTDSIEPANRTLWEHYQNADVTHSAFSGAKPRLSYLIHVTKRLAAKPRPSVLNIGIGSGWFEDRCAEFGWDIHALDPNERSVSSLRSRLISAVTGVITQMPFETNRFDTIVCSEVLEHLRDPELVVGLVEILRCLRPGGHLIGTVPFQEDMTGNLCFCPHCEKSFHKYGHFQSFSKERMEKELTLAGFTMRRAGPRAFADYSRRGVRPILKSLMRSMLGRLGEPISQPSLFFIAKKPA